METVTCTSELVGSTVFVVKTEVGSNDKFSVKHIEVHGSECEKKTSPVALIVSPGYQVKT